MSKIRNYNQGRVKELIENALREVAKDHQAPETGQKHKYPEFDKLPENRMSDDPKGLFIKCFNTETGEPIAICTIEKKFLDLIHDGKLSGGRIHEYNLFMKYAYLKTKD